MGIFCKLNVSSPSSGKFKPGDIVSGVIRYEADKEIEVSYVNVSLRGVGNTVITYRNRKKDPKYFCSEDYVDISKVIEYHGRLKAEERYERRFEFQLPHNIPPSFEYSSTDLDYIIKCNITYYIKIKFKRTEIFKTDKIFSKQILVGTYLNPTLPKEPVRYKSQYELASCRGRDNTLEMKVKVENSVLKPNATLKYHLGISNNTCAQIESVTARLVERYTFKARGHQRIMTHIEIEGTEFQSNPINSRDNQSTEVKINVPRDKYDIQHSTIISRDYFVQVKIMLPAFQLERTFKFPVQVGNEREVRTEDSQVQAIESNVRPPDYDPPPTYWEVMGENQNETNDDEE